MKQPPTTDFVVRIEKNTLLINVPLDLLVWAQEHRDYPYEITDQKAMQKWILRNALVFGGDSEAGYTEFEHYLDRMFDEAAESAEEWIALPEPNEPAPKGKKKVTA